MKKVLFILGIALLLSGCKAMNDVLRQPERKPRRIQETGGATKVPAHRSPTQILPFQSNDAPPPSMLESELSPKEREVLKQYRREGDIIAPREPKDSKKSRNWVFGY